MLKLDNVTISYKNVPTVQNFNLDMKFAAALIKPLTAYYNWSKNRRETKKKKEQDTHKE